MAKINFNFKFKFEFEFECDSDSVRVRVQLVFLLTLHCARASDPRVLITNDLLWLYILYVHTRTHIHRLVAVAIVGLFISVVSLSTCVTFRRNEFIMSAINQYVHSTSLCTVRYAEGCRTSLLSNFNMWINVKSKRLIRLLFKQFSASSLYERPDLSIYKC